MLPPKKLTLEERQALFDLSTQPGFPILMKQLDILIAETEANVMAIDLKPGREVELAYGKARAEGAKRLRFALAKSIDSLRKKAN